MPRPSSWVGRQGGALLGSRRVCSRPATTQVRTARTGSSFITAVLVSAPASVMGASVMGASVMGALVVGVAACSGTSVEVSDAAQRLDATILEAGLAFEDTPSDGSVADALTQPRDGGSSLCRGSCDPTGTGGCGPAEQCALRGDEASCGPAGRGVRGSRCTRVEQCAPGLACFLGETGGVCDRICCPGADDCGDAEVCGGDGTLVDESRASWGRCLGPRTCALLEAMGCPDREACYVVGPLGESACLVAGAALEGEPCTLPNDCAADLVCTGAFERTCARLCRLGAAAEPCASGSSCVRQAYTPEGVGICVAASGTMRG